MSTYAIGDVQGCYQELMTLLDHIHFDKRNDRLWFAGDLVNRGPESLATLRFVKELGNSATTVLGNHDLHLLTVAHKIRPPHRKDSLDDILKAEDSVDLLNWLRQQPLIHDDKELGYCLIHAGLPPQWTLAEAKERAKEVETILAGYDYQAFLEVMYGDQPDQWNPVLEGTDRYRFIINAFTRMRFCNEEGQLALTEKGPPGSQQDPFQPWFTIKNRNSSTNKLLFGHWSTIYLGNITDFEQYNVYPLDTGCLWGGKLTALRLEDATWFDVPSQQTRLQI